LVPQEAQKLAQEVDQDLTGEDVSRPSFFSKRKSNMRADWDSYFMKIADVVATRATCDRKHVGAVIVKNNTILATGYNGSLPGMAHCDDVGHLMEHDHCIRTNHAEANAICQAAKHGSRLAGATIYVTASPCWNCFKLIVSSGILHIAFGEMYRDKRITKFAEESCVSLIDMSQRTT
jgi:dCMP deaminase